MKRSLILFALVLAASTANAQWVDDLYAGTSKRTQTAYTSTYQTTAATQAVSAGQVDSYGVSAAELDNVSNEELITNYEDALARRLSAMRTSSSMDQAYWDIMQQYQMILEQKYDQDLYNIVVVGDQMWVEPIYITSLFTGEDATAGVTAYSEKVIKNIFGEDVDYTVEEDLTEDGTQINIYVNYDPWDWGYSYWGWGGYYWGSSFYNPWGFPYYYNRPGFNVGAWGGFWGGYYGGYYGGYWGGYYIPGYRPNYRPGYIPGHGNNRNNVYIGNNRNGGTRSGGTSGLGGTRGLSATRTLGNNSAVARPTGANTVNGISSSRRNQTSSTVASTDSRRSPFTYGGVGDNFKSGTGVVSQQTNRRTANSDNNSVESNRIQTNRQTLENRNTTNNNNINQLERSENSNRSVINRNSNTNNNMINNSTVRRSTTTTSPSRSTTTRSTTTRSSGGTLRR